MHARACAWYTVRMAARHSGRSQTAPIPEWPWCHGALGSGTSEARTWLIHFGSHTGRMTKVDPCTRRSVLLGLSSHLSILQHPPASRNHIAGQAAGSSSVQSGPVVSCGRLSNRSRSQSSNLGYKMHLAMRDSKRIFGSILDGHQE